MGGNMEGKLEAKVISEVKDEESKSKANPKRGKRGVVENEDTEEDETAGQKPRRGRREVVENKDTEENASQARKRVASSGAGSSPKKARVAPTKGMRSSPRKKVKALKETSDSE